MSLRFLLDTDTVSFAFRGQGSVAKRLAAAARSNVGISAVTLAELRFGASRRNSTRLHSFIDEFTANVRVLPFDADAARHFGLLAAALADAGTPIGQLDTMIAAHALALDVALVSNNTKHFSCVPGLRLENWYLASPSEG